MKYIRTENGIYEIVDDTYIIKNNKLYEKEYFNNPFGDGSDEYLGEVLIGDIIAESDTPEGLCDEFVYDKQGYEMPQRCYQNYCGVWFDEQSIEYLTMEEVSTIKGGIWTKWGFKYVTKMDDEGVLELI